MLPDLFDGVEEGIRAAEGATIVFLEGKYMLRDTDLLSELGLEFLKLRLERLDFRLKIRGGGRGRRAAQEIVQRLSRFRSHGPPAGAPHITLADNSFVALEFLHCAERERAEKSRRAVGG